MKKEEEKYQANDRSNPLTSVSNVLLDMLPHLNVFYIIFILHTGKCWENYSIELRYVCFLGNPWVTCMIRPTVEATSYFRNGKGGRARSVWKSAIHSFMTAMSSIIQVKNKLRAEIKLMKIFSSLPYSNIYQIALHYISSVLHESPILYRVIRRGK